MATSRDRHDKKSQEDGSSENDWDVETACAVTTTKEEERDEKPKIVLTMVNKSELVLQKIFKIHSSFVFDSKKV
jgi:hypothetical protein